MYIIEAYRKWMDEMEEPSHLIILSNHDHLMTLIVQQTINANSLLSFFHLTVLITCPILIQHKQSLKNENDSNSKRTGTGLAG